MNEAELKTALHNAKNEGCIDWMPCNKTWLEFQNEELAKPGTLIQYKPSISSECVLTELIGRMNDVDVDIYSSSMVLRYSIFALKAN